MGYRGEDLDLRTPQTWSAGSADLGADTRGAVRGASPIWVDDTVLSVSNHAFDVALAHRAGEVRLEHLLHALTRIEISAEALEARGVRVAALRRESATIIASEIPVGLPNGKGSPRRSEEFAEVLRLAAANASRRNAPAGIEDLLYVLFERTDLPGLALLARHTVRREPEPLPRYVSEPPRYVPQPKPAPEPVRYAAEAARPFRDFTATPTDSIQNSRLDALEQMVRALSSDLSNERQIVSNLLKELSLQTQEHRSDQVRLQSTVADRLGTLEQSLSQRNSTLIDTGLEQRLADLARTWSGLAERMSNIESALEPRLNDLSRTWSGTADRLDGLLTQRLSAIESGLVQRLNEMARSWTGMTDRVHGLERAVRERSGEAVLPADFHDKLRSAVDLSPIGNRLDIIEEALLSAEPRKGDDALQQIGDRFHSLENDIRQALAASNTGTGRLETLITNIERQRGETLGAMMQPVVERVSAVVGAAQAQQNASNEVLVSVSDRLAAVERALTAEIQTAAAKHQAYTQDLQEVHEALMKLNQNQHTLAGSIDQWRADAAGDLSVISNRLTNLDRDNERPIETLNALSVHMDNMNKMMIERYHRRNRFWYWLFGTDDWIGASWPSQAVALEAERQKFKALKPADA